MTEDDANTAGLTKHSIRIAGHATSFTLEDAFWSELKTIAAQEKISLTGLVQRIDENRTGNLSSALRLFVLGVLKCQIHETSSDKP